MNPVDSKHIVPLEGEEGATRRFFLGAASIAGLGYAAAIAINLARGRHDLTCGCGGPNDRRPIAAWMVWRNLGLALLLGVSVLPWSSRPLEGADALTIGMGTAVIGLLYMSFDLLLGRLQPRVARLPGAP